jgi:hypothetical protein
MVAGGVHRTRWGRWTSGLLGEVQHRPDEQGSSTNNKPRAAAWRHSRKQGGSSEGVKGCGRRMKASAVKKDQVVQQQWAHSGGSDEQWQELQ